MKPTLDVIIDNYERVLLRLHSGELAGIVDDNLTQLQVLRKTHWIDKAITTADLDKSYYRKNSITDFNIDAIAFLSNKSEVSDAIEFGCDEDIDWDWDINNTQCDDQMDAYNYAISTKIDWADILLGRNLINKKGDNKTMTILEIYKERRREKINKKYDDMENAIKQCDPRYKVWKDCVDKLSELYKEDKILTTEHFAPINLSDETIKKININHNARCEELNDLSDKLNEVQAQLSMCETYEQKQDILRTYKIIKENGKVNG